MRVFTREGMRVLIEPIPGVSDPRVLPPEGFAFQCPPLESFSVDFAHSHTDYETVGGGQYSRKGNRQLRTVQFDSLFVDWGTFTLHDESTIEEMSQTLIDVCESGSPFLLTAAHELPPRGYSNWRLVEAGPEIQMAATLRSLKVEERAGEGDTRYVGVSFVEFRDPVTPGALRGRQRRPGRQPFPRTVFLYSDGRARDESGRAYGRPPTQPVTMRLLARKFYGDQFEWEPIAQRNKIFDWGPTDDLRLYPVFQRRFARGQERTKLVIPRPPDMPLVERITSQRTTGR